MLLPNKRILTSALCAIAAFGLWAADTPGQQTTVIHVDTRLVVCTQRWWIRPATWW
jgi:hypothetical protein